MDIKYFALNRVEFISKFYEKALFPFVETKRLVEDNKPPYVAVEYESDEPPFLSEWIDADQSVDLLGMQCASLLCSTLKLFLEESLKNVFRRNSHRVTEFIKKENAYKAGFRKGWLNGYRELFETEFNLNWKESSVNLILIEELVLLRNRGQHPEYITDISNSYSKKDMSKVPSPFFIDNAHGNKNLYSFVAPIIKPQPDKMKAAFDECIKLINWLENSLDDWSELQASSQN
jgi:hypothetical protein